VPRIFFAARARTESRATFMNKRGIAFMSLNAD